jgi:pimeloyl-ACP methyl ester carboxylesterase
MLGEFRNLCGENQRVIIGTLPADSTMDYSGLADSFASVVRDLPACHIIAESFSGPIGTLLANQYPEIVTRLTLVASFVTSPVPRIASFLPWSLIFRLPMPSMIAQYFFVGQYDSQIPTLRKAIRQNTPSILRHRLRLVQNVDVSQDYAKLSCQLLYVRPKQDRLVSQRCVDKILALNPATIVREINGPHLILETQPENAWQQIAG